MTRQPSPITWFELPATDLERATRFYETVLGAPLRRDYPQMHVFPYTMGYPSGCLVVRETSVPAAQGTLIYFDTRGVDGQLSGALARALESGGRPIMPKTDIGPHGSIAVFLDTEGNAVGLHEALPEG